MNAGEGEPARTTRLQSGLEVRSRVVLEEGLSRIDARTRSRLNQARQAAVAAASRSSWVGRLFGSWSRQVLMPATGAAAVAALVAVFMLSGRHQLTASVTDNPASAFDVLDLVTDDDAMNLMEDNDSSFYEWAAAQSDSGAAT
ncbi:MAG TPA: hypothetical protein VHW25_03255 [Steroidobacteraceae bacterium]|jgi:hypothetical protein|nr:hypothetical protein [Steroidobacteraceae bacterium]